MEIGRNQSRTNMVTLGLPRPERAPAEMQDLYGAEVADQVVRLLTEIWNPDNTRWTGFDTLDAIQDPRPPRGRARVAWQREISRGEIPKPPQPLGWETYFHTNIPAIDPTLLPQATRVEDFHRGVLIRLGDDPLDVPREVLEQTRLAIGYPPLPLNQS